MILLELFVCSHSFINILDFFILHTSSEFFKFCIYHFRIIIMSKSKSFSLVEARKLEGFSNYIVWEIKPILILKREKLWDVIKRVVSSTRLSNG